MDERLPVITVSAEISQVPTNRAGAGTVLLRVHRTVEHASQGRSIPAFDKSQGGSAGEREIQVVLADQVRSNVLMFAVLKSGQRDGSINVVKCRGSGGNGRDPPSHAGAFRHE